MTATFYQKNMPATIDMSVNYRGSAQFHKLARLTLKGYLQTPDTTEVAATGVDADGFVTEAYGETVPSDAEANFKKGCTFVDTNATDGDWPEYVNIGDELSCMFRSVAVANAEQEVTFLNDTGAQLDKGTSLYIAGWDATADLPTVAKADKNTKLATFGLQANVANGAQGTMFKKGVVTGLNTAGRAVDDDVWLGDTGAFVFTAPNSSNDMVQVIGQVAVVDATVGEVYFDYTAGADKIGSDQLQQQSVNANILHNDARMNYMTLRAREALPAPTGANQLNNRFRIMQAPVNMELVAVRIIPSASTSGSDATNRYEFNVVNVTQAANLMSAASVTDGNELAANTARELVMNQNTANIQNNDVLAVNVDIKDDGSAGPTDLSAATFDIEVEWRLRA